MGSSDVPYKYLTIERRPKNNVFIITLRKAPENRINTFFAQEIIRALREIEATIGPDQPGAVITRGSDTKFWCTGIDLEEGERNPHASTDGFFPLLATLLDYPFPTVALLTGHTFGGACPLALAHDYRVMNSQRGFFSMPPVDLGLHFDGIGALPRLKLRPQIARKMLLEAHRWTSRDALADGIVDEVAAPNEMLERAVALAEQWAPKARMGVYALLRQELWGDAADRFKRISYTHARSTIPPAKAKV